MSKKKKKQQTPDEQTLNEMNTVFQNEMTGAIPANPQDDEDYPDTRE